MELESYLKQIADTYLIRLHKKPYEIVVSANIRDDLVFVINPGAPPIVMFNQYWLAWNALQGTRSKLIDMLHNAVTCVPRATLGDTVKRQGYIAYSIPKKRLIRVKGLAESTKAIELIHTDKFSFSCAFQMTIADPYTEESVSLSSQVSSWEAFIQLKSRVINQLVERLNQLAEDVDPAPLKEIKGSENITTFEYSPLVKEKKENK